MYKEWNWEINILYLDMVAFNRLVQQTARNDMNGYTRNPTSVPLRLDSLTSIQNFSWEKWLAEWQISMPTVFAACAGALESMCYTDKSTYARKCTCFMNYIRQRS